MIPKSSQPHQHQSARVFPVRPEEPSSTASERINGLRHHSHISSSNGHESRNMDSVPPSCLNGASTEYDTKGNVIYGGAPVPQDQRLQHPFDNEMQQRDKQQPPRPNKAHNSGGENPTSNSLSIAPPKPSPLLAEPPQPQQQPQQQEGQQPQWQQQQQQTLNVTNNQDSLGSSLSKSGFARRASFNLSTGILNLTPKSSSSLASPSSPSYSTLAVARARAAAAQQGQGVRDEDISGSGVFPGVVASVPIPEALFSSSSLSPSSSSSTSSYDSPTAALSAVSRRPSHHADPSSLPSSSSSSLHSHGSTTSPTGSGSGSGPSSAALPPTHLQDNAMAEREVSMILEDFLYLGGELVDEEQIRELENLGIKRVLNMAVNCEDDIWIQRFGHKGYLKVGLRDHVDQDLKDGLDEAIKFIATSKEPIYVHCQAGKSRSVATVIGYLIQEHHWPLKRAYDHVVERRRCMSPNIGFVSQLIMLEERVLGPERAGGLACS
ncbi:hypothetical protein BGX28_006307 [Mortierella sp. GBA30]|nr:hypothetical protein BGX28_006307 [Mortierella sp. GBA30]